MTWVISDYCRSSWFRDCLSPTVQFGWCRLHRVISQEVRAWDVPDIFFLVSPTFSAYSPIQQWYYMYLICFFIRLIIGTLNLIRPIRFQLTVLPLDSEIWYVLMLGNCCMWYFKRFLGHILLLKIIWQPGKESINLVWILHVNGESLDLLCLLPHEIYLTWSWHWVLQSLTLVRLLFLNRVHQWKILNRTQLGLKRWFPWIWSDVGLRPWPDADVSDYDISYDSIMIRMDRLDNAPLEFTLKFRILDHPDHVSLLQVPCLLHPTPVSSEQFVLTSLNPCSMPLVNFLLDVGKSSWPSFRTVVSSHWTRMSIRDEKVIGSNCCPCIWHVWV